MANLYELSAEYAALLDRYEMAESDEERDLVIADIESATDDIATKAEAYCRIIKNKEAEAAGFETEAKRLTERKRAAENVVKRLKAALLDSMKLTGQTEIKTSIGKWKLQNNPWSCEVFDWEKVPVEFRTPQPDKIDKKGLVDRWKATGEIIDGVEFRQEQGIRFR